MQNSTISRTVIASLFATLVHSSVNAAALSKKDLLALVDQKVQPAVLAALVRKDCVDFDIDATTLAELSSKLPQEVLLAAIECRKATPQAPPLSAGAGGGTRQPDASGSQGTTAERRVLHELTGTWFRLIPAGTFIMGCEDNDPACQSNERPAHQVTISKPFWMTETEVTNAEYAKCIEAGVCPRRRLEEPSSAAFRGSHNLDPVKSPDYPVAIVSWDSAVGYCNWLGGRLPTEAEWEYAARAGGKVQVSAQAQPSSKSGDQSVSTTAVRASTPNAFGLYGMNDNVSEWIGDWYAGKYYQTSPATDPPGPEKSSYFPKTRVRRGGSFTMTSPRISFRSWWMPSGDSVDLGIRCVKAAI